MTKKTNALISGIVGGVATIATAVVTYIQPAYAPAIVGGIGIAATATVEICNLFTKTEQRVTASGEDVTHHINAAFFA